MFKHASARRPMIVSLTLSCFLLLAFTLIGTLVFSSTKPAAAAGSHSRASSLVGPKQHYLALGDSLAFGFQPNGDFTHGYVPDFFKQDLQKDGVKDFLNLGCPGETSTTFINGGCPAAPSSPPQLASALAYLQANAGTVSPVTLDIGANDTLRDIDPTTCTINQSQFATDLATLHVNLTQVILPQLRAALTVNGQLTGELVMVNYYDPFQNICPNTVPFTQTLNQQLANDVSGFGSIVDVFDAFGGAKVPNPHICKDTWMCAASPLGPNIHPTDKGYELIADTFDKGTGF
jgi:lysophospholipase L1-like esterase